MSSHNEYTIGKKRYQLMPVDLLQIVPVCLPVVKRVDRRVKAVDDT